MKFEKSLKIYEKIIIENIDMKKFRN